VVTVKRLGEALPRREAQGLLELLPVGVILLNPASRVIAANRIGERILAQADGLAVHGRRLCAADPRENEVLQALVRAAAGDAPSHGQAAPVSRPSGRRPLQLLISPLGTNGDAGRRPPPVALLVSDPDEPVEIPVERLRRLYGLTLAEARIASRLAAGLRPEALGRELGVQTNTVRMHLKRIFAKTRTGRQSELVALLLRGAARLSTHGDL
jgi:DNA-binding CsgD family transcriptional regulator